MKQQDHHQQRCSVVEKPKKSFVFSFLLIFLFAFKPADSSGQTITSFSPTSGPVGTSVIITGTGFSPDLNWNFVFFGPYIATVTAASPTELTVIVPPGAPTGFIRILGNYSTTQFHVTAEANIDFMPSVNFTGGILPESIDIGDIDGDGKNDLAVVNLNNDDVYIYRNTSVVGTASLENPYVLPVLHDPVDVKIADIDRDGKQDIVVASLNGYAVWIFRNTSSPGSISFATPQFFATPGNCVAIDIGDLNGDGWLDIVATSLQFHKLSIFKNFSSPGTIYLLSRIDFDTDIDPFSVTINDMNADGRPDITVANLNSNTVSIFRNTTVSGTLTFAPKFNIATVGHPQHIKSGDLDGDGRPEILVTDMDLNAVSVFRNITVSGAFVFEPKKDFYTDSDPRDISLRDIDGDGRSDLAVSRDEYGVAVFRNLSSPGTIALADKLIFNYPYSSRSVVIGDIDGDNKPDLSIANLGLSTSVLLQSCTSAGQPTVETTNDNNCGAVNTQLRITSGLLNNNLYWKWYSGSCGGTLVGQGTTVTVSPSETTTYYARGEGGSAEPGQCSSITITVIQPTSYYPDADGDGYGNGNPADSVQNCTTAPAGFVANNLDCNDADAAINPLAVEICDGIDNNCNGQIDEGVTQIFYRDNDGDGFGNAALSVQACTMPTGYVTDNSDCDDNIAAVNPGATETCDGIDNNCDGQIDEGLTQTFYRDNDGDGFGNAALSVQACTMPSGYVADNTDCDDNNIAVNPAVTEICNGIDDDCDGQIDEALLQTYYRDNDGDGYGNPGSTVQSCTVPDGYVANNTDCNDNNASVNPGVTEICNGVDDDCDGLIDEGVTPTFYRDNDGDGFGNPGIATQACTMPAGFVSNNTDCDDSNAAVNPNATEICNGIDDDCDGLVDEGLTIVFYRDADGDGYGNALVSITACAAPAGYVTNNTDCNDGNAVIYPGAPEICDGLDNDCNGEIDEGVTQTYYVDADGDGYGNPAMPMQGCSMAQGWVNNNLDCDDNRPAAHPGATEICNGIDDDCDGLVDEGVTTTFYADADGDGFGNASVSIIACTAPAGYVNNDGDCNDNNGAIYPGAVEVCDGIDNDCNGQVDNIAGVVYYLDADSDGYGGNNIIVASPCEVPAGYVTITGDCDDNNAAIYPGAAEICDGLDNDCDGETDENVGQLYFLDADGDGFGNPGVSINACVAPPGFTTNNTDCDDMDANTSPGADEICDGRDNNCNGQADEGLTMQTYYPDMDGDGFGDSKHPGISSCNIITGYVSNNTDCDDFNPALPTMLYIDADGDGFGAGNVVVYCSKDKPDGYSTNNSDCNDSDASVHQQTMYYVDADGDGFGGETGQLFCLAVAPAGYSPYNSDCNDNDATEQCCVFTNPMTFTAPAIGNCYPLTYDHNQIGAVWGNNTVNLNADFDLNFAFTLSGPTSTGMMFVLQNTGISAMGSTTAGGDLGYYNSPGFSQSIGVELDYANSGAPYFDLNDAHLTIVKNGDPSPVSGTYDFAKSPDYEASYNVRIAWNHTTHLLTVYFNGTQALSYTKDLVNEIFGGNAAVYIGFTSANEPTNDPRSKPPTQSFCVNELSYENPLIIYPASSAICNSGQLLTNAAANCTFLWSTGATTPTIEITQSGTYSVIVTNIEGCMTTVSYNAVVNAGPVITASATQLCPGASITLTSSTSDSYLWSTGETTQSIVVNTPGEYNVSNGVCGAQQPIVVTAVAASIEASGPITLCPGESVTLTASEGSSYLWSTGAVTREIIVDATGLYSVNITYPEGCTLEASVQVKVGAMAKPNVFASNSGNPYNCEYPFVELNQDTYPEFDQYTFTWYKVGVADPLVADQPMSLLQVDQPGQYYLVVKRNNCTSEISDSLVVTYNNGDPSVFGNNAWNVYVWQNGMPSPMNPNGGLAYKGYYVEQNLSFDTRSRWSEFASPSFMPDYTGCPVWDDFFKWSAKRKGFAPGMYAIRVPAYDENAQLLINANLVWSDVCCSNSGNTIVWTGYLNADSEIEFSVTETMAFAYGAIQFELIECSVPQPVITYGESTAICEGQSITLSTNEGFETYTWMLDGNILEVANSNQLIAQAAGVYTVTIGSGSCTSLPSEPVTISVTPSSTYYRDADGDGYGNPEDNTQACSAQEGYVLNNTDCNDADAAVYPGAPEICDNKDNNCNGTIDEGFLVTTYYRDADGDGYGNTAVTTTAKCAVPAGYVTNNTDCNDADAAIYPGAPEICDNKDNNCNGTIDEGFPVTTYYRDADGDGYGNPAVTTTAKCAAPAGYVTNNTDCNDADASVHAPIKYYTDADKDGYGAGTGKTVTICSSTAPAGYSSNNTDCNDKNANINPGAPELCDGIDNNCNGQIDEGCPMVTVSINDMSIVEGNTGKKAITFNVTLSQSSSRSVTVNYATTNGTATTPSDYTSKSGSLTFKAGSVSQQVSVSIIGDKTIEPDEEFYVTLTNPSNAVIAKGTGIGKILNDDGPPPAGRAIQITPGAPTTSQAPEPVVKLWPNPARHEVNLLLNEYSGIVTLKLLTMEGRLLQQQVIQVGKTGIVYKLDVSRYLTGTYLVTLSDSKGSIYTGKLIIVR